MSAVSPIAFMSYARLDDEYTEGYLTEFRERLERAVRLHTGKHDFEIFQDKIVRAGMELSFHTPDELVGGSV